MSLEVRDGTPSAIAKYLREQEEFTSAGAHPSTTREALNELKNIIERLKKVIEDLGEEI